MKTKVSVVIPNYNGEEYLLDCLDSLMAQDVRSFEIIVVDDASTDDSFEQAKRKYPANGAYPKTRYIQHAKNLGFCASVNDGIAAAEGEYIFLLNNDTVVDSHCIHELYKAITSSDKIFSVAAKMVDLKNPEIMDDGGDYFCSLGWAFSPAKGQLENRYTKKRRIFSACGGAAMYRRKLLLELGGFDDLHFAYLEDVDIGYRARLKGYVNLLAPRGKVLHAGSASSGSRYNAFKAKLSAQNNLYVIYKNMPLWQILLNLPLLLAGTCIKFGFYCIKGLGLSYGKGLLQGLKLCQSEECKLRRALLDEITPGNLWKIQFELCWNTLRRIFPLFP